MSFFPYFLCALLGVDSVRGGLAEGNRISKCHQIACTIAIWGLLGAPWHGLHGPSGHYVGLHGCSSTRSVTK